MFKPYEGNEKYIFVSYNHDDSEKVYDIITEFYHRGYRIWHDRLPILNHNTACRNSNSP